MVQLSRQACAVWVMLEDDRPIGQVVAPARTPALGPGAGTVLLQRGPVAVPTRRAGPGRADCV
jgi:hypothetical protein